MKWQPINEAPPWLRDKAAAWRPPPGASEVSSIAPWRTGAALGLDGHLYLVLRRDGAAVGFIKTELPT